MRLTELLNKDEVTISCELFPPKQGAQLENYKNIVKDMAALKPAYMSVTYGAGGSAVGKSVALVSIVKHTRWEEPATGKIPADGPIIPALPAEAVLAAQGTEGVRAEGEQVLVQGIADLVLVYPDHLELLDYKTDRRKTEADFLRVYRAQLNLYALAIDKRFAPKKVT